MRHEPDRSFLLRHLDEFRSEVLGDLDSDECALAVEDYHEFGRIVAMKFEEWRRAYEADAAIYEEELRRERAAWMREKA